VFFTALLTQSQLDETILEVFKKAPSLQEGITNTFAEFKQVCENFRVQQVYNKSQ